jgi:hypothetical protein
LTHHCHTKTLNPLQVTNDLKLPILPPTPEALGHFCNSGGEKNNAVYQHCKKPLGFKVSVFLLLLFCHIVASYWNQIVAKRNIKNGEEILVAYGSKYAPILKKNVADLQEQNRKAEISAQKEIMSKVKIVKK